MAAGILLLPFLVALTFAIYDRTRNPFHPFFALLGIFATLIVANFAFADTVRFYPLRASGLGGIVLGLTSVGLGVLAATLFAPPPGPNAAPRLATTHDADGIMRLAVVLFVLSTLSTIWYWYDVASLLGLGDVMTNPARLKAAELSGFINSNSSKYLFRGALFVPVILTLAVFMKPERRLPKLMLFLYLATVLVGVRRGPILQAFSAALSTAVVAADSPKRLAAPIAIGGTVFVAVSVSLLVLLQRLNLQIGPTLFGYTAGNLSSFQAVLDDYYPPDVHLPLEHTLWFFYSAMKYVSPMLTPASIIKPNPFQDLPNTYTFLTDYYLDLGPVGLVIPPLCVGILMGLSYCLVVRKPGFIALILFAAVYAVATDSFLNNAWGWLTIPMSVVFGAIASVVLLAPSNAMARFRRLELMRVGASSGSGGGPPAQPTV